MNKERLYYLDIARGFAILLIVLGHLTSSDNIFVKWIYSFHLILFFIISGYLLKVKKSENVKLYDALKVRAKTVLLPYFTFSLIFIVSDFILKGFSVSILIYDIAYTILLVSPSALWFLPAFFIGELLVLAIIKFKNGYLKYISIIGCILIPLVVSSMNYNFLMLLISRSLIACALIFIGYSLKPFIEKTTVVQSIIMLAVTFILAQINSSVDLSSLNFGNMFLYLFNGIVATVAVIGICKSINRNNLLEFYGVNTIIIMGTHQWMTKLFVMYFGNENILSIVTFIIIMSIEIPIIYLINNYAPWMLGKFKSKEKTEIGLA